MLEWFPMGMAVIPKVDNKWVTPLLHPVPEPKDISVCCLGCLFDKAIGGLTRAHELWPNLPRSRDTIDERGGETKRAEA